MWWKGPAPPAAWVRPTPKKSELFIIPVFVKSCEPVWGKIKQQITILSQVRFLQKGSLIKGSHLEDHPR